MRDRGYFALGVYHPKTEHNIGTLWRSAYLFGASFIFTIGRRYKPQGSDTPQAWKHIPLFNYETFEEMKDSLPRSCMLVGVELSDKAIPLEKFSHPERTCYLLGAEDHGLPPAVMQKCHAIVKMRGEQSMNVAVAGSIVIYDRIAKREPV